MCVNIRSTFNHKLWKTAESESEKSSEDKVVDGDKETFSSSYHKHKIVSCRWVQT